MRNVVRSFRWVAIGTVVLAFTAASASAGDLDGKDFVVIETAGHHYLDDVGRQGYSLGDSDTFIQPLKRGESRVGREDGRCDVTQRIKQKVNFHCVETFTFGTRGQITAQGNLILDFSKRSAENVLAITGGTGAYDGASGSVQVSDDSSVVRLHFCSTS